jgi:glycosyltransferase involved in cell wall biosynthesis
MVASQVPASRGTIVFVLKGYPRLSETFIANEIASLERRGMDIAIVSLRHPTDRLRHPVHAEIRAPVLYLPEYLHDEPARLLRALLKVRWRGLLSLLPLWLRDYRRDRTRNRIRRLGQAIVLAAELPAGTRWLHAHFLHTPASVTRYAARLAGLPWSASAHARDIWTTGAWEKAEKLADCRWAVTCTRENADHLSALAPPGRVGLVYHGLPLDRFPPPPARAPRTAPAVILSVGRLVEKKGYADLLAALGALAAREDWHFHHVGGGPLRDALQAQADALGIGHRVTWHGPAAQEQVLEHYRRADLFVLASRTAGDGDRDGLPNVLVEAQSQGLPCISTRLSAIPELIEDGRTGLLVEPGDTGAITTAITTLLDDPARRAALGAAGMARARSAFDHSAGIDQLMQRFDAGLAVR